MVLFLLSQIGEADDIAEQYVSSEGKLANYHTIYCGNDAASYSCTKGQLYGQ